MLSEENGPCAVPAEELASNLLKRARQMERERDALKFAFSGLMAGRGHNDLVSVGEIDKAMTDALVSTFDRDQVDG